MLYWRLSLPKTPFHCFRPFIFPLRLLAITTGECYQQLSIVYTHRRISYAIVHSDVKQTCFVTQASVSAKVCLLGNILTCRCLTRWRWWSGRQWSGTRYWWVFNHRGAGDNRWACHWRRSGWACDCRCQWVSDHGWRCKCLWGNNMQLQLVIYIHSLNNHHMELINNENHLSD